MTWKGLAAILLIVCASGTAVAQFGAAPDGEATVVAQKIIRSNFTDADCSLVVEATRLGDGTIRARCNNGEIFRVMSTVALRCSAAKALGVSGC